MTLTSAPDSVKSEYDAYASEHEEPPVAWTAYTARAGFVTAEDEMRWDAQKRVLWFEATMKSWKRVIEMSERGELGREAN